MPEHGLVSADVEKLHEAIGELRSEIRVLSGKFEELRSSTIAEHRKVHDIVVAQSEAVRNLDRDVREIKPLVEDYREKRAEWRGAARFAAWLYGAAGILGGFVVWLISKAAEMFSARPHP